MPFTLPELPYAYDALMPYMSKETLEFHHDKHHNAYVVKGNEFAQAAGLGDKTLEQVVVSSFKNPAQAGLFNNAGLHWNHIHFWNCMKPNGGGAPAGALAEAINAKWGSLDAFKTAFQTSAVGNFGSGWTWLVKKADGSVDIVNMGAAGTPLTTGDKALLCVDVWEHAYYVDYRNMRPKYVDLGADRSRIRTWGLAPYRRKRPFPGRSQRPQRRAVLPSARPALRCRPNPEHLQRAGAVATD